MAALERVQSPEHTNESSRRRGRESGRGVRVKVKVLRIGSGIPSFCHRGWNPASREKLPSKLEALSFYLLLTHRRDVHVKLWK